MLIVIKTTHRRSNLLKKKHYLKFPERILSMLPFLFTCIIKMSLDMLKLLKLDLSMSMIRDIEGLSNT